jgi:hypothetical protein
MAYLGDSENEYWEDDLIDWIEDGNQDEIVQTLVDAANEKFGGRSYELYKGFMSKNVKGRGISEHLNDDDMGLALSDELDELDAELDGTGLRIYPDGRQGGHWTIATDWNGNGSGVPTPQELIDELFDVSDNESNGGYDFTPNEKFTLINQLWESMIEGNEKMTSLDGTLQESKVRPIDHTILKEGAALAHIQAIIDGEEPALSAEEVAPAHPDPSIEYDEEEDPEMMEGTPKQITESMKRIHEAAMTDAARIRGYMTSKTKGPKSYEDFAGSDFGSDSIDAAKFKTYVKNQMVRGDYDITPEDEGAIFARKAGGGGGSKGGKPDNFYTPPEIDAKYKKSSRLTAYEKRFASETMDNEASGNADQMFQNMIDIVADIASGVATKRHALIFGDPGVGKTYECTRALEANLNHGKYEMKYYKGNVGKSITACAAFFYKYSAGYVIMLDDNDAMLMKSGVSQQVKLFFKALLDPDAIGQPIAVPSTVLKGASAAMEALDQEAPKPKPKGKPNGKREGIKVQIDRERLREGHFTMYVNGREALDQIIPLEEALDFYDTTYDPLSSSRRHLSERNGAKYLQKPWLRKLYESDEDDDDDFVDDDDKDWDDLANEAKKSKKVRTEDDDDIYDPNGEELDANSMPSSFIFNSSVIFISNLEKDDIDPAVWDRFTTAKIALNPLEYMDRLGKIYPHLGNVNAEISSVPQSYVDWAKKVTLGVMEGIMEAWQTKTPLLGVTIQIPRRVLTFRLFSDMVEFFLRAARSYDRRAGGKGGKFDDKAYQTKVAENVELDLIKFGLKKIVFGE